MRYVLWAILYLSAWLSMCFLLDSFSVGRAMSAAAGAVVSLVGSLSFAALEPGGLK